MSEKTSGLGVISRDEMYTLKEFKSRLRLTDTAMRELRRKGLVVYRLGKRAFVNGTQAISFMIEKGISSDEGQGCQNQVEVFGDALDMPRNGTTDATIGEDKRPSES